MESWYLQLLRGIKKLILFFQTGPGHSQFDVCSISKHSSWVLLHKLCCPVVSNPCCGRPDLLCLWEQWHHTKLCLVLEIWSFKGYSWLTRGSQLCHSTSGSAGAGEGEGTLVAWTGLVCSYLYSAFPTHLFLTRPPFVLDSISKRRFNRVLNLALMDMIAHTTKVSLPISLTGCVCLYLLHIKCQIMHSTNKVRTFLGSRNIWLVLITSNICLRGKTWF